MHPGGGVEVGLVSLQYMNMKARFRAMAALQILAIFPGIAAVRALRYP